MDIEALREAWHRATEKDRPQDAIKALIALERELPKDALWSQRLGEAYRRVGQKDEAVEAFARACDKFLVQGFVPRAIAMTKLVGMMDHVRGAQLEQLLPKTKSLTPPPLPRKAAPLILVEEATEDEIRFTDEPESSVTILLVDMSRHDSIDVEAQDALVDSPPSEMPPSSTPPTAIPPPPDKATTMASVRLFAGLPEDAVIALAKASELLELPSGTPVVARHEPASALYAIISGNAKVAFANGSSVELEEGDVFGESTLLMDAERQADVEAAGPLMALRIEKKKLDMVTALHPEVEDALFELLARRLITNLIATAPLFLTFEMRVRFELAQMFEVRRADPGTVIAERGRKSDGLYILLAGSLESAAEGEAPRPVPLGTAFGHGSLVGEPTAKTTIRVVTESVLLRMPASSFAAFAMQYPPALAHLAETAGP